MLQCLDGSDIEEVLACCSSTCKMHADLSLVPTALAGERRGLGLSAPGAISLSRPRMFCILEASKHSGAFALMSMSSPGQRTVSAVRFEPTHTYV